MANSKTDVWMPLYIGDYLAATTHLSAEESGAYLHLLMHEWKNGPLPDNDTLLSRISRMGSSSWITSKDTIRAFFEVDGGKLFQKRLEAERSGARSRQANSEIRNNARWGDATTQERGRDLRSKRLAEARQKGTHTLNQWEALKRHFGGLCVKCKNASDIVKDHITPIYRGGSDGIENIQPLCRKCNTSKGPEDIDYRADGWLEAIGASPEASEMPSNASPSPSPSPSPSSTKEQIQKPSRGKRESDSRSGEFKSACEAYYTFKRLVMTWDAAEGKQLSALLAANPTLDLAQFQGILRNRSKSQVNHAERPRAWLSRATDYAAGPLDKFGKPLEVSDAGRTFNTKSKSGQVLDDLRRSLEEDGFPVGFGEAGNSQAGQPGERNDGYVRCGPDADGRNERSIGAGIALLPPAS